MDFNNCFGDFCEALYDCTSITKLTVALVGESKIVHAALRYLPCLKTLAIQPSTMRGDSFRWLFSSLAATRISLESIHVICDFDRFRFRGFHDEEIDGLCEWLNGFAETTHQGNSLRHFWLERHRVLSHRRLLSVLTSFPNLQHVKLSGPHTYFDSVNDPIAECRALSEFLLMPSLRTLDLAGAVLAPCHCEAFAESMKETQIDELFLTSCNFHIEGVEKIAQVAGSKKSRLRSLMIESSQYFGSPVSGHTIDLTLSFIPLKLETLTIHNVSVQETTYHGISQALLRGGCTLREVQLGSCGFSSTGMSYITEALRYNRSLESLSLRDIMLSDKIHGELRSALQANNTLRKLVLESCNLSSEGLIALAAVIRTNSSLKVLDTSHNMNISDDAISKALLALHQNESLRQWRMVGFRGFHCNPKRECKKVVDAFEGNYTMECFDVSMGDFAVQCQIATLERLNKAGRRYLRQDPLALTVFSDVLANVNDSLDAVYTHLLENPAIFQTFRTPRVAVAFEGEYHISQCWA